MSDETTAVPQAVPTEATPTDVSVTATPDATGEKAERVFTQAELDAIVKERLDRANRKAEESVKKAQTEAEIKALAEQGKFKELYEKALADAKAAQDKATALELATLKRDIAARVGLPAQLAARLQGDDEAAIEQDAKSLLASLPKPSVPNINSAPGSSNGTPALPAGITEEALRAQAVRLGVDPDAFVKQFVRRN